MLAASSTLMTAGILGASVAAATAAQAAPVQAAPSRSAQSIIWVYVWATNVNVRVGSTAACSNYPSTTNCPTIYRKVSEQNIGVYCQKRGQPISNSGYSSEWWSYTYNGSERPTGWVSNVFIRGKAHLDGVPDCAW
ncbi:hypothetical protein [Actinomadura chokoriensis]|uniref:SH3 domain-containing protein n=1 Tax=Actinomadura chokoriensis TaxID=454156 RepID=A0ABV4QVW9_9ACTN